MFKDNARVCFLGDSITHAHPYHSMVYAYLLTRFPDRRIRFINAGVAGDTAGCAMVRVREDVISKSPSTVVIAMGMNDVGRPNYVTNPSPAQLGAQSDALEGYRTNMTKLLDLLQAEISSEFILVSPTPFDQTCENGLDNNQPGCNDGLAKCVGILDELAPRYKARVVNLHGPMTAFNLERQKQDPTFTLIGPDRVHPGFFGNFMMACLFLKAMGAPARVSELHLDANTGNIIDSKNATVEKTSEGTFMVLEKALPYPVSSELNRLLDQIPIEEDLNQQTIRIAGLRPGRHSLLIDGAPVESRDAEEWARGVNLAMNPATPQFRQSAQVAEVNEQRRLAEVRLRGYACVRWFMRHRGINPDDLPAVRTFAETKMEKTGYYQERVPTYLTEWENRQEVIEEVAALEEQLFKMRTPVPHSYSLCQP